MDEPNNAPSTRAGDNTVEAQNMAEEQASAAANIGENEAETTQSEAGTPDETVIDVAALQAEIEQLKRETQTNLDGWQRSRAEFTNYRRRTTQELADARERGALDALAKVLPIMDDFERALANTPEGLDGDPWMNGTALILKNLQKVMDGYDIEEIDPVGTEFDPNVHEAVGMEDSDEYESGVVTTTLQKGYRSGDRVLRPALVRVAN